MQKKMQIALKEARKAFEAGEVPVGAAIFKDGILIAHAHNRCEKKKDALAHAEMLVITQAQQVLKSSRLTGCELYVTVEPCLMCAGAIIASRISRLVYGIEEPKMGCIYSKMFLYDVIGQHRLEIYGSILAEESKRLMQAFFSNKR